MSEELRVEGEVGVGDRPVESLPRGRVRRVPPELRRKRVKIGAEPSAVRRLVLRLKHDSQSLRSATQLAFALLCLWIGVEFYLFVRWGMSGGSAPYVSRPPGAEGFLPISALISLKHWILTSTINTIHPAALFILLAVILVSVVVKKAFCSWLCPVGTLSESLWLLGERLFGRNLDLPRWVDIPLRSVKYLILLFFLWAVSGMDASGLGEFIESPYNRMADVKMFFFFAHISTFALGVLFVLIVLSIVVKNFWCRYLCPYGALLGLASFLSPFKITREASSCIDCNLCTKVCPSRIPVHEAGRVWSDECNSCLRCVEVCPVKDTLLLRSRVSRKEIPHWVFGLLIAGIFVAVTGMAMLTGHWSNSISSDEYQQRFQQIDSPLYEH
ncbi:MAG TPA: 4Fe-4S binding protein [Bacteroidota bacterium]|nr:4Fe-4S binding protein [Bacteroidota bacterium]